MNYIFQEVDDIYVGNRDIEPIVNERKYPSAELPAMVTTDNSIMDTTVPTAMDMQAYMQAAASGVLPTSQTAPTVGMLINSFLRFKRFQICAKIHGSNFFNTVMAITKW